MLVKLIGKKAVDYVSRKTNKQVTGVQLQVTYEDANTVGLAVDTIYISSAHKCFEDIMKYPLNVEYNTEYNRYGNVENVIPCK